MFILSCATVKPYTDLGIIADRRVIEAIQNRAKGINSLNATLSLAPAVIRAPKLDAYLSYTREGPFRLSGLTPTGLTLFNLETQDNQFTISLPNGRAISGSMGDFITGFKDILGVDVPVDPGVVKEALDFYGGEGEPGILFLVEETGDYYILNQLGSYGDMAYPVRRWWIDKGKMTVVRKEIFSRRPEKTGERLFEALYKDFRIVDDVWTPFEIVVNDKKGKKLLTMKFNKVEYNK